MIHIVLLAAATFVSEDLACLSAGGLIRRSEISAAAGVIGCTVGILAGDLALWLIGRTFGRRALQIRWISRRVRPAKVRQTGAWLDRNLLGAVVAARFLPGTRLPLYLTAGIARTDPRRFLLAATLAAILWTPALVLLAAALGETLTRPLERLFGLGWAAMLASTLAAYLVFRFVRFACSEIGRARLIARVSRLWRWEFWPMIVFYPPVALWIAWLSIRHRGFMTITAANPAIPHGGFVGESKYAILRGLRSHHVLPAALIDGEDRAAQFQQAMTSLELSFPVILKPDVGQRGAGVRLIRSRAEAADCLRDSRVPMIVQKFHSGPFEAGIFYYRMPGRRLGRIFSITDKVFPHVVGDGESTLRQLVWRHTRYRMQAATFLARHQEQADRVLLRGRKFALALAGNHCQGTMFRDGSHLVTPALRRAIDRVAQSFDGFHFGRFDVRYADPDSFRRGEDFAIVELNGITSESTNIYDPSRSLLWAYRKLFTQWAILFQIGAANRRRGHRASPLRELLREVIRHYLGPRAIALAD